MAQDSEVVALKEKYAVDFLKRAADMQTAGLAALETGDFGVKPLDTGSDSSACGAV